MPKLLRPIPVRHSATEEHRMRAWEIVQSHGHTTLARFTLFEDKLYFFSTGGSMVAFVLQGKAAITLGDPIGPTTDFGSCLTEFNTFCARNHWLPVYYQVLPDHLNTYTAVGFDFICIGHDAVIDLSTFTLARKGCKNIRNSFNKMIRLGYKIQVCDPPHDTDLIQELNQVSDAWLSNRGGFEIGFSLGSLDVNYLNTCPIILVCSPEGRTEAFANIVFEFQANEATIDLMRFRPGSQNGQMDYLFVSALHWAQRSGIATFNLGFSPFTGIGKEPHSSFIERGLRFIHEHAIRAPNFNGLHFFKEKFSPVWAPRYIVYPRWTSLPRVALGIMRAYKVDHLLGLYWPRRK